MGERKAFETLEEFQPVVLRTRVTAGKHVIQLKEGLSTAVRSIQQIERKGNKVVLIGNGGSAAIASHQAIDLWKNGGIRATAFNDASLLTCISNDLGYENVFAKPIEMFCDKGDLCLAISSSGKSPNILNAVAHARAVGCGVITFSGFDTDNPLSTLGDLNFYVPSHRYGTVEVGHLLLIHSFIDEVIALKEQARSRKKATKSKEARA